ncbi:lipopolysaccharide biosynthesis protein [Polynucleobacter paneuropaeus]|jgi:O-antigen/teichoic acid export membrane protein|nr:lipopolysaccharide biosynthesis protein [Polynucleobacter paneuropaeus]
MVFVQGLILTPLIVKVSGPETYGTYILLVSYLSVIFGISSFGVGVSAKRWLPGIFDSKSRAHEFYPQFWFQLSTASALGLALVILFTLISSWNSSLSGVSPWILFGYITCYTIYSQAVDYFRYTHRIIFFNIGTISQSYLFVFLSLGCYLITKTISVPDLILMATITYLLIGGGLLSILIHELGFQFRLPKASYLSSEMSIGLAMTFTFLVDISLTIGDRFLIGGILAPKDLALYVPAYTIGSLAMIVPRVIGVVLPPLMSRHVDEGNELEARRQSEAALKIFLAVSVPFFFGSLILGGDILRIFTNESIAQASWQIIPLVAAGSIFYGMTLIMDGILFIRLKTKVIFRINFIGAIFNIGLNVLLLSIFKNVIVSGVVTLLSYFICYFLLRKELLRDQMVFRFNWPWFFRIFFSSLFMSFVLLMLIIGNFSALINVFLLILIGIFSYALALILQFDKLKIILISNSNFQGKG